MKKNIFFIFLFFVGTISFVAQNTIYKTNSASINFSATKKNVEPIKAKNVKAKVILNETTGEIACLMTITDFEFPNKLMQEHFNENYLESDTYPKASFTGKIDDFATVDFSKKQTLNLVGEFNIHGITKKEKVSIQILKKDGDYTIESIFKLKLKDFKIKIPSLMFYKITEEVEVSLLSSLKQ